MLAQPSSSRFHPNNMNRIIFLLAISALFFSCDKDLENCSGNYCVKANGYVYDLLTLEPLNSANVTITYKENCGWCGTGCLFREFFIGTVTTNKSGYFQADFSCRRFNDINGAYVFDIEYEDFIEESIGVPNSGQNEIYTKSQLNPPAFLNLSISLIGTDNLKYFGLSIYADSLTSIPIGGYNSNERGLFRDSVFTFRVPAEKMIYFGYLVKTDLTEKYADDSILILRNDTMNINVTE